MKERGEGGSGGVKKALASPASLEYQTQMKQGKGRKQQIPGVSVPCRTVFNAIHSAAAATATARILSGSQLHHQGTLSGNDVAVVAVAPPSVVCDRPALPTSLEPALGALTTATGLY